MRGLLTRYEATGYDSKREHRLEAEARWFGVEQENDIGYNLYTTDRFAEIAIEMGDGPDSVEQFPSLVSFIGETGMDPLRIGRPVLGTLRLCQD